jgi:hypothetical protein
MLSRPHQPLHSYVPGSIATDRSITETTAHTGIAISENLRSGNLREGGRSGADIVFVALYRCVFSRSFFLCQLLSKFLPINNLESRAGGSQLPEDMMMDGIVVC